MEETVKWEYTSQYLWKDVSDVDTRNNQILNKHGNEGWELVSVDNNIAYFRRPLETIPPAIIVVYTDRSQDAQELANQIRKHLGR